MRRVSVIANCHCWPLAQALSMICRDVVTDHILINNLSDPSAPWTSKLERLRSSSKDDVIFTFELGPDFGLAETDRIRSECAARVVTFSNIRFDGLHPDMTYFGRRGVRRSGFLGEYHSKIILSSYAHGLSEADCLNMFTPRVFDDLGFMSIYDRSRDELHRRDQALDVKFARPFMSLTGRRRTLLTFNHPTSETLTVLADAMARFAGIGISSMDSECFANPLAGSFIWPVYPEIVEMHGLPYRGSYDFILPNRDDDGYPSRVIALGDLIAKSYDHYGRHYPFDAFVKAVEDLDFHPLFTAALGSA